MAFGLLNVVPAMTQGDRIPSTVRRRDAQVVLLFSYLAVPLVAAEFAGVDMQAVAPLVVPIYIPLLGLVALFHLIGVGSAVGSTPFYVAYVGWAFVVALAAVTAGRLVVSIYEK